MICLLKKITEKIFAKKISENNANTQSIAELLSLSIEDITTAKKLDEKIIIGKILKITEHPDPKITKVRVTKCDLGNGETEQILCGGTNIQEGAIVPIATIGSDLGGGFVIGERKIRGEVSRGMICARVELGLSANKETKGEIWLMPKTMEKQIGKKLKDLA